MNKKTIEKHYPLLTVKGKSVGMNVIFRKTSKWWRFQAWPDMWLDIYSIDRLFPWLCELDGFMASVEEAFNDYPDRCGAELSSRRELHPWPMRLNGKCFSFEHAIYIVEQATLPHWKNAAKILEERLGSQYFNREEEAKMFKEYFSDEVRHKYYENEKKRTQKS